MKFGWRGLLVGIALCVSFTAAFFLPAGDRRSYAQGVGTQTPSATLQVSASPTPDLEIEANRDQTTGIIIGTIFLVLIIIVGTLASSRVLPDDE